MSAFDAARLARIDARMGEWVAEGAYERLEWCLGDPSGVVHAGAAGGPGGGAAAAGSVYRIYSMTKPVVSVVAMQLVEEGRLQLFHPVSRFLPEFDAPIVFTRDGPRPASQPLQVHHLLTHMSGLSYGFLADASAMMMNAAGVHEDASVSLRDDVRKIAAIPLQFEPGADWRYSVATDVLAALIEVIEDAPLGEVLARRIFAPLGMEATGFTADPARVAPIKGGAEGGLLSAASMAQRYPADNPDFARGGHGLFSTLADYALFAGALLRDAAGAGRLLSAVTLAHMTANHAAAAMPIRIEQLRAAAGPGLVGQGFGLGFAVAQAGGPLPAPPGAFGWSGAAETWFTVDPASGLFAVFMGQNFDWPGANYDLQCMTYGALRG